MLKKILSIFLTAALLISVLPVLASAESTEIFKVEVDASTSTVSDTPVIYNQGDEITVKIRVSQNPGITSLKLVIDFDETALELANNGYVAGRLFSIDDQLTYHVRDNGDEYFIFYYDAEATDETGILAQFKFIAKDVCVEDVAINVSLWGGSKYACMNNYDVVDYEFIAKPIAVHSIDTTTGVVTAPDCENEGYTTYTCSICEESVIGNVVAPNGHTEAPFAAIDKLQLATCTEDGSYDQVIFCIVEGCNKELSREHVVIPASGHKNGDAVVENKVDASCTADGSYDSVVYCTVCKEEQSRDKVTLPMTEHTPAEPVKEKEVAPSCTATGSYDLVTYCTGCNKELKRETVIVPMTEHTPGEAVVENKVNATCTVAGSYDSVVYCTACKKMLSREPVIIPVIDHTPASAVIEKEVAATCTAAGSYDEVVYCAVCHKELERKTVSVPMKDHTAAAAVVENKVDATCTAAGSYDEVVYCTVCHKELERKTVSVPMKDHTAGEPVVDKIVEADCDTDGSFDTVVFCEVCSKELSRETEIVAALGHDLLHHEAKAPSYNSVGWNAYDTCKNCDYTTYVEIPALTYIVGDLNADGEVTDADAIYLLYATFDEESYPLNQDADFDGDGEVTDADAIYLLYATFEPDTYPLG